MGINRIRRVLTPIISKYVITLFLFGLFFFGILSQDVTYKKFLRKESFSSFGFTKMVVLEEKGYTQCEESPGTQSNESKVVRRVKSEYTLNEQLAKWLLLLIILICAYGYSQGQNSSYTTLRVSFFCLSMIMYLAESNMIVELLQPLLGLMIGAFIVTFLIANQLWMPILFLFLGLAFLAGGIISDFISENEFVRNIFPSQVKLFLTEIEEERLEVIGTGFLFISVLLSFLEPMAKLLKNNIKYGLGILCFSCLLAFGNGFLHYQYHPNIKLQFLGLLLSVTGCLGLLIANKVLIKRHHISLMENERLFSVFLIGVFIILPLAYRNFYNPLFLSIGWVLMISGLAWYLIRKGKSRERLVDNLLVGNGGL